MDSYAGPRLPPTLIEHIRREHQALWPAIVAVIEAHLQWAGPVILEGWQLDPARVASLTHPQLRADPAFYHGCGDVERLIRHYLARSRWVNDRVRQAAGARDERTLAAVACMPSLDDSAFTERP